MDACMCKEKKSDFVYILAGLKATNSMLMEFCIPSTFLLQCKNMNSDRKKK